MVSIIKNQIIKHLSIFAKNLKPEQISLEVLGGTGELRNIVLNEAVLTEKLELPPFLKLKKAECNRVKIKIPWTKLSTSPVQIIVDELQVVLQLGHAKAPDPPKKSSGSNSYGFADKVVEGLSIKINVLDVSFESDSFSGSIWLSPLIVESKSPIWQDVTNLKRSRISDSSCHQVIFFKQVSWNLMKIQAFAHGKDSSDRGQRLNSPLRLITQGGKCRIAIKKDSNDGSLLAGRIQTIFDEIHWVATLAEVRSAIAFYKHILTLAKASSTDASDNPFLVDYSAKSRSKQQTLPNPAIKSTIFKQFDVGQTSHHVYINKVHMTLIDDHNNEMDYPSNWNTKSGAIQVTLEKITIDYYLQNLITDERRFWVRYNAPNEFTNFANGELLRHLTFLSQGLDPNARERLNRLWSTLTSETLVVRIDDIVVECVSEQTTKRDDLQDAYTSKTSSKLPLPQNLPAFHFEFSNFLFPGSTTPESPKPLAHIVVGPANILLDPRTIRWLLYVVDNITRSIDINESQNDVQVLCARIDLVMPKLIIPCPVIEEDCRYPQKFVVNVSTVTLSNRALENETFSVENLFQQLTDENIQFISEIGGELQDLRNHVLQAKQLAAELATNGASLDLLPTRWYISTSPLWMEAVVSVPNFTGKVLTGPTVISDVMLAGCIEVKSPNIYIAVEPLNSLTVIIDHFQFVQLMRVQKSISNLVEQLELDKQFFSKLSSVQSENSPLSLYCFCDEINAHLILPIGIAPSPYDLVYSFPKSDTETSISSDIKPEKYEDFQNQLPQANVIAAVTVASNIPPAAPSPIPPVVIQTVDLPDFGNNVAIADDLTSNFDESMSMVSDDDSALFDAAAAQIDDIFPEVAEEATEVDEVQITKRQLKLLEKNVNALSATLSNFNVIVSTHNGKSNITGYSLGINVAEELNVPLKNIFDKHRAPSTLMADKAATSPLSPASAQNDPRDRGFKEAQLQFKVSAEGVGEDKYAHVIAKIRELNLSLDEQVVSYLGPFIRDDSQEEDPLFLELNIEDSKIQIVNPKRKNPLRIHLGDIKIEDGEERKI